MNHQQLRAVVLGIPFRPFTLQLLDGRSFRVPHPEFVELAPPKETGSLEDDPFDLVVHTVHGDRAQFAPNQVRDVILHGVNPSQPS